MIDSINVVVERVERLDKSYIKKELGIRVKYKKKYEMETFVYKDIKFMYYIWYKNLEIETTTHKILGKKDITLSDMKKFKEKMNSIINIVLNTQGYNYSLKLTRTDYYVDVNVGDQLQEYIKLLHKHREKFGRLKAKKRYDSSVYLKTKSGKTLNLYSKEICIKDRGNRKIEKIRRKYKNDEEKMMFKIQEIETKVQEQSKTYKGVIRLELQNRKGALKSYLRTTKNANKKDADVVIAKRKIDYYWNQKSMQKYYFDILAKYLYKGKYYKLSKAIEIIQNSKLTKSWKNKLICFLGAIKFYGIDEIKENAYNYNTFKSYIKRLTKLNINPITIDEDSEYDMLESLYTLAVKQAESKYFI